METREQTLVAMKKLVYFPHNYGVFNAFAQVWPGQENAPMREHLLAKFQDNGNDFFRFFLDLDAKNQRLVLEFVLDNYDGVRSV